MLQVKVLFLPDLKRLACTDITAAVTEILHFCVALSVLLPVVLLMHRLLSCSSQRCLPHGCILAADTEREREKGGGGGDALSEIEECVCITCYLSPSHITHSSGITIIMSVIIAAY